MKKEKTAQDTLGHLQGCLHVRRHFQKRNRVQKRGLTPALVQEMKKEKTAQDTLGRPQGCLHVRRHSKSGTASKSRFFREAFQRLDAKNVFRFWNGAWVGSQRPSLFSPFSSLRLLFFFLGYSEIQLSLPSDNDVQKTRLVIIILTR
ncbi:hypothetical protein [Brevibacillus borstelensis]|uniref:hypothetical protein n=1 Tax=Brevibacillus borstelensis TaxID=45462 RepID=UPI0030BAAF47